MKKTVNSKDKRRLSVKRGVNLKGDARDYSSGINEGGWLSQMHNEEIRGECMQMIGNIVRIMQMYGLRGADMNRLGTLTAGWRKSWWRIVSDLRQSDLPAIDILYYLQWICRCIGIPPGMAMHAQLNDEMLIQGMERTSIWIKVASNQRRSGKIPDFDEKRKRITTFSQLSSHNSISNISLDDLWRGRITEDKDLSY